MDTLVVYKRGKYCPHWSQKKQKTQNLEYETSITSKYVHVKIQQKSTVALNNKKID